MKINRLHRKLMRKIFIILPVLLFLCFTFCFTSSAQGSSSTEIKRNMQIINPNPIFSLRLRLEKGDQASYIPGERVTLSCESTKDAYVTIYQYDVDGRIRILFPNKLIPHNFARGGRLYQVEGMISLDSAFGPGYLQGFATTRPLLMRDRFQDILAKDFPVISFDLREFTSNLRNLLNQLTRENWVSSNILEYQVVRPYYTSGRVGRVMAISIPQGAEVYLNNQYYGISPKRIEDVQVGQHLLEFVLPGYEVWSRTITVSSNLTTQMEAKLDPVEYYGEISMFCDQANALVFLDGKEFGKTAIKGQITIVNVNEGYHELTVIKPGFLTWTETVRVMGGESLPVYAYLVKLTF